MNKAAYTDFQRVQETTALELVSVCTDIKEAEIMAVDYTNDNGFAVKRAIVGYQYLEYKPSAQDCKSKTLLERVKIPEHK